MFSKLFLLLFPVIFSSGGHYIDFPVLHPILNNIIGDSLPPLHSIQGSEISTVSSSFQNATVTVTLKNGTVYNYNRPDWDYEDYYPSTDPAIKTAINSVKITFTKAEHMPEFPGGSDAWSKYLREFCLQHEKEIRKYGPKEFGVSFIVHIHGQVSDVQIYQGESESKLASLAIDCIKGSPVWIPAVQNGRAVPCYQRQLVKLSK